MNSLSKDKYGLNFHNDDRNISLDDFSENEKVFGLLIGLILGGIFIVELIRGIFY